MSVLDTSIIMGGKKSSFQFIEVCLLLFLLLVDRSTCYVQYNDGLQLKEEEHCEAPNGATGVCVPLEKCSSDLYTILKLSSCPGSRTICCPKFSSGLSSRQRRYTWQNVPYSQSQQPKWQNSNNNGQTHQNYHNGYNNQNFDNDYNDQYWHSGYNDGHNHQNHHNGYKDQDSHHSYDHKNWHDGHHNDHSGHNYNNGYNEQHWHNDHDHHNQNWPTDSSYHNEKEHSNNNFQNGYNDQHFTNGNNNHFTLQNDDKVQTTQTPVSKSENPMTIGNLGNKGATILPTSQGSTFTNQIENATQLPILPKRKAYVEPNPVPAALSGNRISEKKCVEYREHMKNLVTEGNTVEKKRCAWHADPNILDFFPVYLGKNSTIGEFPHMVAVGWPLKTGGYDFKCGGTLISESYVLTAGHCLSTSSLDNTTSSLEPTVVRLGAFRLLDTVDNVLHLITIPVKRILRHPSYKAPVKYFDIGLIEMAQKVNFTLEIRPACLWTEPGFGPYNHSVVTGWGKLSVRGQRPELLQKASLELYENSFCAPLLDGVRNRNWRNGLADSQLCAGDLKNGTDTCQGDSGSPLAVAYKDNQCLFFVMGVTSFGRPCGTLNSPGIYTRVSSFVDWIESVVWGDTADGHVVFP